jgi:hypothetical protein
MINLYKTLIQSKFDYANNALSMTKTVFEKIERIQSTSIRLCLGLVRSTPLHVMFNEAGIFPIKDRIKCIIGKRMIKRIALGKGKK